MPYTLNASGKRVMLNVLANADASMIGIQIGNSRIISMQENELSAIVLSVYGAFMRYHLFHTLAKYHVLKPKDDGTSEPLIVMETVEENDVPVDYRKILNLLKLYKSTDIFSCYVAFYKYKDNAWSHGGAGEMIQPEHPVYWPYKTYEMTQEERTQFFSWYSEHLGMFGNDNNEKYKQIVRMYLDSFMVGNAEMSFVILSVILEMLFGAPNGELTYRISRGVAVFLSTSRDEMRNIQAQVKKLYALRSKYVHEGKKIQWEKLFELRELVRRIIVLMYEREMNKSNFDFKMFADEITYDGYEHGSVSAGFQHN